MLAAGSPAMPVNSATKQSLMSRTFAVENRSVLNSTEHWSLS
jgi:hypothetical protein